jgi:hypothetical protein
VHRDECVSNVESALALTLDEPRFRVEPRSAKVAKVRIELAARAGNHAAKTALAVVIPKPWINAERGMLGILEVQLVSLVLPHGWRRGGTFSEVRGMLH